MDTSVTRRSFLGIASASALALSACTGTAGADAEASSPSSTPVNGTLTVGSACPPGSYDPHIYSCDFCLSANRNVVEGLYEIDLHTYTVADGLCVGEPFWFDAYTCEIVLREGATFSNGAPVTPEDVVRSFDRASAEGMPFQPLLSMFDAIALWSDNSLLVSVNIPWFPLVKERLSIIKVIPADLSDEEIATRPVGSGPWMYTDTSEEGATLEPNPFYNGSHPALAQQLRIYSLPTIEQRIDAQEDGTTLICESVTPSAVQQLSEYGCTVENVHGFATRFVMFNVRKAPWDNKNVRQAVMYALNTPRMIEEIFPDMALEPSCYLPASCKSYHEAQTVYRYDPEKAKSLLEGIEVVPQIVLRTTDDAEGVAMGTQAQTDIREVLGCEVDLVSESEGATYLAIDQADDSWDILIAPGNPSPLGVDTDLLLNWWFGDNIWMQTRCAWKDSEAWEQLHGLMMDAREKTGIEQQECWNQVFDIIADECVLYPLLQVVTSTASWKENANPDGLRLEGFWAIGAPGVVLNETAMFAD